MSDQTTIQQPQEKPISQNSNVTSVDKDPEPPCCTAPPGDPGPTT